MTREGETSKVALEFANEEIFASPYDAFMAGAQWADQHPQWISVEDELPTKDEFYLCVIGDTIQVLFYNEGLEEWYEFYVTKEEHLDCEDWTKKVTHWMPLPQPPKKGGEE